MGSGSVKKFRCKAIKARETPAMRAVHQMRADSVAKGLHKMTLKEINAEINEVRRCSKLKKSCP